MNYQLLYPEGKKTESLDRGRRERNIANLRLAELVKNIYDGLDYQTDVESLYELTSDDPAVIGFRNDIIADLLSNPKLCESFFHIASVLDRLKKYTSNMGHRKNPLCDLALMYYRISGLADILTRLKEAFEAAPPLSQGMKLLARITEESWQSTKVPRLKEELSCLNLEWLHNKQLSLGFNLGGSGREIHAFTLAGVSAQSIGRSSLLFFSQDEEIEGVSGTKLIPNFSTFPMFQRRVLKMYYDYYHKDIKQLSGVLDKYSDEAIQNFLDMDLSFAFYAGALSLYKRLGDRGFPCVKPTLKTGKTVSILAKGVYPSELALDETVVTVPNDVRFTEEGKFYILTGANSSGKTVFLTSVGQLVWLVSLGFYVPCESVEIVPASGIFTIFSGGETDDYSDSRMGNEVRQLRDTLPAVNSRSFILFNEPLTSTSPKEGSQIASDIIRSLLDRSVVGVVATHFFELFELIPHMEEDHPGKVGSLITVTLPAKPGEMARRTYKVTEGSPASNSFALEIAFQYEITMKQIIEKVNARCSSASSIEVTDELCELIHQREKEGQKA